MESQPCFAAPAGLVVVFVLAAEPVESAAACRQVWELVWAALLGFWRAALEVVEVLPERVDLKRDPEILPPVEQDSVGRPVHSTFLPERKETDSMGLRVNSMERPSRIVSALIEHKPWPGKPERSKTEPRQERKPVGDIPDGSHKPETTRRSMSSTW